MVGRDVLDFQVADLSQTQAAADAVAGIGREEPRVNLEDGHVALSVDSPVGVITHAVRRLDEAGIKLRDLAIRRPTLDDVFLTLTGEHIGDEEEETEEVAAASGPGGRQS